MAINLKTAVFFSLPVTGQKSQSYINQVVTLEQLGFEEGELNGQPPTLPQQQVNEIHADPLLTPEQKQKKVMEIIRQFETAYKANISVADLIPQRVVDYLINKGITSKDPNEDAPYISADKLTVTTTANGEGFQVSGAAVWG